MDCNGASSVIFPGPAGADITEPASVARWAYHVLYRGDENFKAWLEGLGFDLSEDGEEEE